MESVNIVDPVIAHDKESFMQAFTAAMTNKVSDALELKKVELASSLLTPQQSETETVQNEPQEVQAEVDGTESAEG